MGAASSIPNSLDAATAKEIAGEKWDASAFDAISKDGKITKDQFLNAEKEQNAENEPDATKTEEEAGATLSAENLKQFGKDAAAAAEKEMIDWETCSSSAYETLEKIKKADITEIKAFAKPPAGVSDVMSATLICLKSKGTDWSDAKKMLCNSSFLKYLMEFEPQSIDSKMIKKLKKYTQLDHFTAEKMKHVSKAASGLCAWVLAVYEYGTQQINSVD